MFFNKYTKVVVVGRNAMPKASSDLTLTGVMSLQRSSAGQEHAHGHKHSGSTSSMGSNRDNRRDTGSSAGGSRSTRVSENRCDFLLPLAH
jgi:hypothetical protein